MIGKGNTLMKWGLGLIGIYVGIQIMVVTLPLLFTGLNNISTISGLSFASFFATGGVVFLIVSVAILYMLFKSVGHGKGGLGR